MTDMSTTSLMTFAEFELLPEIVGKRELIAGAVMVMAEAFTAAVATFLGC